MMMKIPALSTARVFLHRSRARRGLPPSVVPCLGSISTAFLLDQWSARGASRRGHRVLRRVRDESGEKAYRRRERRN